MHNIVVVGGSAGAMDPLLTLVRQLPKDFPASIFVVLHTSPQSPGYLPDILTRGGALQACHAMDGMEFQKGRIYVAPPDQHLVLTRTCMRVNGGPKENTFRPAVDPLFRSAAAAFGSQVIGVILSGGLDDGTSGLWDIKRRGGISIVQDPETAVLSGMPKNAMHYVSIDYVSKPADLGQLVNRLAREHASEKSAPISKLLEVESRMNVENTIEETYTQQIGKPSVYACPECNGVLFEIDQGEIRRYRCRVGHAYTLLSAVQERNGALEEEMWELVKSLSELKGMIDELLKSKAFAGDTDERLAFERKMRLAGEQQKKLHEMIMQQFGPTAPKAADPADAKPAEQAHPQDPTPPA